MPRTREGRWAFDPQPAPDADLRSALGELAAAYSEHGLATSVDLDDPERLDAASARLLVRVVQEALHHADRRGAASRVTITLRPMESGFCLEVVDDGVGFDTAALPSRPGPDHDGEPDLEALVRDAGGELRIQLRPAAGTTVHVEVPA